MSDVSSKIIKFDCKHIFRHFQSQSNSDNNSVGLCEISWECIIATYRSKLMVSAVLKLVADGLYFILPWTVELLVVYMKNNSMTYSENLKNGLTIILLYIISRILCIICMNMHHNQASALAIFTRSVLTVLIYQEVLNSGSITGLTLVATDSFKVEVGIQTIHNFISCVAMILISAGLLIRVFGVASLVAFCSLLSFVFLQTKLLKHAAIANNKSLKFSDKRTKVMEEILKSIRVIKVYAWESIFIKKIYEIRDVESKLIYTSSRFIGLGFVIAVAMPFTVQLIACAMFAYINNGLNTSAVYASLMIISNIRFSIFALSNAATNFADMKDSLRRINSFVRYNHLHKSLSNDNVDSLSYAVSKRIANDKVYAVAFNANFAWSINYTELCLKQLSFNIPLHGFTAIVGKVGCGKTSLLHALMGQLIHIDGEFNKIRSKVSYVPQQAWILNGTLKENVLFESRYDSERFATCIRDCALTRDIEMLPMGSDTLVGTKGVNLSGGQKQRINIARAVYADTDALILDDMFSALDTHVQSYIFHKLLLERLKSKTRILVTHHLQFLQLADYIIYMEEGRILEQGTYNDVVNLENGRLRELLNAFCVVNNHDASNQTAKRRFSLINQPSDSTTNVRKPILFESKVKSQKQYWKRIKSYIDSCGGWRFICLWFGLFIVVNGTRLMCDRWLSWWARLNFNIRQDLYEIIFMGLIIILCLLAFIMNMYNSFLAWKSSNYFHQQIVTRLINASIRYFDSTAIGDVLNVCTKHMRVLDSKLTNQMFLANFNSIFALGCLIVVATTSFWFAFVIPPFIFYFVSIYLYTRDALMDLKKMNSQSLVPLLNHVSATCSGYKLIKSYEKIEQFTNKTYQCLNAINKTSFILNCSTRWIGQRVEIMGVLLTCALLTTIIIDKQAIQPDLAALAYVYATGISSFLCTTLSCIVEAQCTLESPETVDEFILSIDNEDKQLQNTAVSLQWPSHGTVEFNQVFLKFGPDQPFVLNGISFVVDKKTKVGIVGRTGAGKSTLVAALFRLTDIHSGKIMIDGTDIMTVSAQYLRSKLAIIPQEPILFSGSIKFNIDPFDIYREDILWDLLKTAQLSRALQDLPNKLQTNIDTSAGGEMSVGQKAFICIARALIRKSKIVILDEATASVDYETDAQIQECIRNNFDSTVLTIAHRLNTIIDYDKIMVLDAGRVAEFDSYTNLLNIKNGLFKKLSGNQDFQ